MTLVLLSALALLVGSAAKSPSEIPLRIIYANPAAFEGKTLRTCSRRAPIKGRMLFADMTIGRSPVAMYLDRRIQSATGCIDAKVERWTSYDVDAEAKMWESAKDGPIFPKHWRLKVLRVDPR
jgi:hypothetical protein